MPRRPRGRRRRPVYDWVTTEQGYDTCGFYVIGANGRSTCDSPVVHGFPLTSAPIMANDSNMAYGMPNLRRNLVAVRGQYHHVWSPYAPEAITTSNRHIWVHHRIIKAQVDLNQDPATRYTTGLNPISLASHLSSDEDFVWERKHLYRFYADSFGAFWSDAVITFAAPSMQPHSYDLNVKVGRRLEEDEALFFLTEVQQIVEDSAIPDLSYYTNLRSLIRVPR